MRRRALGLTLLEMLMVIAILALLVVALIVYLLPSDDRRVRLEAERMAAYLDAAGAEAIMRDGPVRVAFDFGEQAYDREVARVGADLNATPFEDDPAADRNKVRQPVRLTTVLLPAAGDLTSGTAWMLWKSRDTDGGVAILELNEAVWSVIVDPNTGEVRAERGRATLPARAPGRSRGLFGNGLPGLGDGGVLDEATLAQLGQGAGALPPSPSSGGEIPPEGDETDHDEGDPEADPGPEGGEGETPEGGDPQEPEDPEEPEPDDEDEDDEDDPPECQTDADCEPLHKCTPQPTPDGPPRQACVFDPTGFAFRLSDADLGGEPNDGLKLIFDHEVKRRIRDWQFNLIVTFDSLQQPGDEGSPVFGWVVQGHLAGAGGGSNLATFRPDPNLPSYPALATRMICTFPESKYCYEVRVLGEGGQTDRLTLYLPSQAASAGKCPYLEVTIIAAMRLELAVDPVENRPKVTMMTIEGAVRETDAKQITYRSPGGEQMTLARAFDEVGFEKEDIFIKDGEGDGWPLGFFGRGAVVELADDPSLYRGRDPCK